MALKTAQPPLAKVSGFRHIPFIPPTPFPAWDRVGKTLSKAKTKKSLQVSLGPRFHMKHHISVALMLLGSIDPAGAFGFTFSNAEPREYSYPADPHYQIEPRGHANKSARKCPKGQAVWQGKCRIALPVYPSR
jgi:hypothetical protein